MSQEQLLAWGWSIPFLLSILLVGIGLYIHLRPEESPVLKDVAEKQTAVRLPIAVALKHYWKELILATGSVGAAFAPIVTSVLITNVQASWPIVLYIIAMAAVSFISLMLVAETNRVDMKADRVTAV